MVRTFVVTALLVVAAAAPAVGQTLPPVRGVIDEATENALTIRSRDGRTQSVKLNENYIVLVVTPAPLEDVQPGTYLSTAGVRKPDGVLEAAQILLFPEVARGIDEGQYPYDLPPGSLAMYATVSTRVDGPAGLLLTLAYKGGEAKIAVRPGTPVVTFDLGEPALLRPGAAVYVTGEQMADGRLDATRVFVGKNGLVPPM
jgi:hypothetical protein